MSTAQAARTTVQLPVGPRQSRARSWWTGWRLALRMARRDVRRDRGRSWFVWLMIAVPVALIAASQVLIASSELSPREWAELHTGGNPARITWTGQAFTAELSDYGQVVPDAERTTAVPPPPGWAESIASRQDAVSRLLGRPATAITSSSGTFGPLATPISVLGLDPRAPGASGLIRLTDGRLPDGPGEVLATSRAARLDLPAADEVPVTMAGMTVTLTVVGHAETTLGELPDLIGLPRADADELGFLISGDPPVTYADAQRLAGRGFTTASRHIVAHEQLPRSGTGFGLAELTAAGGLIEVALLVGPAFAIGAARQRRSLALAATNGATTGQLRRTALGQAVLLGASAALTGTLLGTAVAVALWPVIASDRTMVHGPLDIPIGNLALLFGLGTLTALCSALFATRGLGHLALVSALRGTVRSGTPGRGAPVAGAVLTAAAVAAAWLAGNADPAHGWLIAVIWLTSAVVAVAGVLLATPSLLGLLGRIGGAMSATVRMALRDLARQRGRATATVASVVGGVMLLTAVWTLMDSRELDEARRDVPEALFGQGLIRSTDGTDAGLIGIEAAVHAVDPALRTTRVSSIAVPAPGSDGDYLSVVALRRNCPTVEAFDPGSSRCRSLIAGYDEGIVVGSPADLTRLFVLSPAQREALATGHLLVNTEPVQRYNGIAVNEIADGTLRLAYLDEIGTGAEPRTVEVPAVPVTTALIGRGVPPSRYSALISTRTAAALGWGTQAWHVLVADPDGPIGSDTQARVDAALDGTDLRMNVERGYKPPPQPQMWLIAGTLALLAVIGASISTVLATAELRPFLATFAAVGAPPTLTRRLATVQAGTLALLATTLGSALGLALGAPVALFATRGDQLDPTLGLPWLPIGLFTLAVPLAACAVAALSVSSASPTPPASRG